jgi:hypothetical protein
LATSSLPPFLEALLHCLANLQVSAKQVLLVPLASSLVEVLAILTTRQVPQSLAKEQLSPMSQSTSVVHAMAELAIEALL